MIIPSLNDDFIIITGIVTMMLVILFLMSPLFPQLPLLGFELPNLFLDSLLVAATVARFASMRKDEGERPRIYAVGLANLFLFNIFGSMATVGIRA